MRLLRLVSRRYAEERAEDEKALPPAASAPSSERLTVVAAARRLGVSESTVRRRVRSGTLRHLRERTADRSRIWVILDAPRPASVAPLPAVSAATMPGAGPRWAVRHRHSLAWLVGDEAGARLTPALDGARLFGTEADAEQARRLGGAELEVVAVYRPSAITA